MKQRILSVGRVDKFELIRFTPGILDLFGKYYPEKISLRRIIRFGMALKCGYEIYYLTDGDKTCAYCTVQSGKSKRFDYSDEKDIIIGPYAVVESYRGNGVASRLVEKVLEIKKGTYKSAFAYIKKENIASIRTCEKVGFRYYSDAVITGLVRNVRKTNKTDSSYLIMKDEGKNK